MLLGTLGVSLLENLLIGKGINRAGEGIVSAGEVIWIFNTASSFN